jgi:hypothetical protein
LHLQRERAELRDLLALVSRYRLRLGAELLLRFIVRGLIVGALLVIAVSATDWLLELQLQPLYLWAALLMPAVAALGLALALWPSERQAARVADHRLQLAERVGTAVELGRKHTTPGLFDQLQLQDAIATVTTTPHRWPSFVKSLKTELLIGLGVGALAAMSLLLPSLPKPRFEPTAEAPAEAVTAMDDRLVPTEVLDIPGLDAMTIDAQTVEADLAPRVRQAQAEQEALDRLAQALGQISAGQSAADAIKRGDFGDARSQLSSLGEEADQLSDAAKKQLAQALQQAAAASGADRQLADRERQAAVSLSRNNYADQRNALRQLGEQVERSGARSVPAAQLARDAGRLQQQQASGGAQGAQGQAPPASSIQAQPGAGMMSGAQGGQSGTGTEAGEQGGVGAGTGTTDGVGDPAGRLGTQGQLVEVPTKLGAGTGQRPTDGTEDQVGTNPGMASRTVAEAAQTQQTGQVTPEQNLVPGDQRPVVRGYFR